VREEPQKNETAQARCPGCGHSCCPYPGLECGGDSDVVRDCVYAEVYGSPPEPYLCGHAERTPGCGGCDPGAVEFVITDDGRFRPFDPVLHMSTPPG